MDKKEQTRLRVQRYRNKKNSVTKETALHQSVTPVVTEEWLRSHRQNPHRIRPTVDCPGGLAYRLAYDRPKLQSIYKDLKAHGVESEVRLGVNGYTFKELAPLLM